MPCMQSLRNAHLLDRPHTKVHMRLRAALCLIKLAKVRDFDRAMSSSFETIATMAMEPCFEARQKFLVKLSEVLPAQRLLPRWNAIPALSAVDPNPENILLVSCLKSCRKAELMFRLNRSWSTTSERVGTCRQRIKSRGYRCRLLG